MNQIAKTPDPPYYAVVFTSVRTDTGKGYADTAAKMLAWNTSSNLNALAHYCHSRAGGGSTGSPPPARE